MTDTKKIVFLDLVTQHLQLEEELVEMFRTSLRTASFVGGPLVEGFELEFAKFCEAKYCIGVSSGTTPCALPSWLRECAWAIVLLRFRTRLSQPRKRFPRRERFRSSWILTNKPTRWIRKSSAIFLKRTALSTSLRVSPCPEEQGGLCPQSCLFTFMAILRTWMQSMRSRKSISSPLSRTLAKRMVPSIFPGGKKRGKRPAPLDKRLLSAFIRERIWGLVAKLVQ